MWNAAIRRRWPTKEAYEKESIKVVGLLVAALPEYLDDACDPWHLHSATAHIMDWAAESGRSAEEEARDFIEERMSKGTN